MSDAILSSQLPTAADLSGLSMLLTDATGHMNQINALSVLLPICGLFTEDLNSLKKTGIYAVGGGVQNGPPYLQSGDTLIVLQVWTGVITQILIGFFNSRISKRVYTNDVWTQWTSIELT